MLRARAVCLAQECKNRKGRRGEDVISTFIIGALQARVSLASFVPQSSLSSSSSRHSSKVQTHQKCTVLIPIGLSHNLFAQLWFPAGAAVLCHLLPCCWNRALVDRNACAWLCAVKNCDCERKAGRAARRSVLGAGMVTLLLSNALTTSRINQLTFVRATRGRGRAVQIREYAKCRGERRERRVRFRAKVGLKVKGQPGVVEFKIVEAREALSDLCGHNLAPLMQAKLCRELASV